MLQRLIHKADFDSLMSAPIWSRSAHFAVHHLPHGPQLLKGGRREGETEMLSTDIAGNSAVPVDKNSGLVWAGAMVPKRQARRAVTRNLLKRQIRQAFIRHQALLSRGLWLVRLRRGFDKVSYPSARSLQLAEVARVELDALLQHAPTESRQNRQKPPRAAEVV